MLPALAQAVNASGAPRLPRTSATRTWRRSAGTLRRPAPGIAATRPAA